ncbi:MAG: M20/M25/M40 family metallo-hydrolase [Planctomycetota bacterium]
MSALLLLLFPFAIFQTPAGPSAVARTEDPLTPAALANRLLDEGLASQGAFRILSSLVAAAPRRLSGSDGFQDAVAWGVETMHRIGLKNVRRESVSIPRWERGDPERVFATLRDGTRIELSCCALGSSIATSSDGITAEVVELDGLDALKATKKDLRGKIVFLDGPMDPTARATFSAYGKAVGQRVSGASEAARKGAIGLLIRSMSTAHDDAPHTGNMHYQEGVEKIPALALGVLSAEKLGRKLAAGEVASVTLRSHCRTLADRASSNVVGEIPGTDLAGEIVLVGGHLDAWELGQGAHDDGAGCAHSLEAVRLLLKTGYRPRRTIRVVLFANEENGLHGARAYAEAHAKEKHFFAMESDSGGFAPRGISISIKGGDLDSLAGLAHPLEAVGAGRVFPGGGGADVSPLAQQGVPVGSLRPADARYFDLHHSRNDVLEAVNPRELELGAVTVAYWLAMIADLDPGNLSGT